MNFCWPGKTLFLCTSTIGISIYRFELFQKGSFFYLVKMQIKKYVMHLQYLQFALSTSIVLIGPHKSK